MGEQLSLKGKGHDHDPRIRVMDFVHPFVLGWPVSRMSASVTFCLCENKDKAWDEERRLSVESRGRWAGLLV